MININCSDIVIGTSYDPGKKPFGKISPISSYHCIQYLLDSKLQCMLPIVQVYNGICPVWGLKLQNFWFSMKTTKYTTVYVTEKA